MASPHRFSEVTNPGDEPVLMDEGFEIVEDDAAMGDAEVAESPQSGSAVPWILLGMLVTAVTATVLLVALPMYDEALALRADKGRISDALESANARVQQLTGELEALDATQARLTATIAQKTVALEDSERVQSDLAKKLHDEVQKNEAHAAAASTQVSHKRSRRR